MQISETSLVSGCMCLSSVTTASSRPTWRSRRRADVNAGGEDWGQSGQPSFKVAQLGAVYHTCAPSLSSLPGAWTEQNNMKDNEAKVAECSVAGAGFHTAVATPSVCRCTRNTRGKAEHSHSKHVRVQSSFICFHQGTDALHPKVQEMPASP